LTLPIKIPNYNISCSIYFFDLVSISDIVLYYLIFADYFVIYCVFRFYSALTWRLGFNLILTLDIGYSALTWFFGFLLGFNLGYWIFRVGYWIFSFNLVLWFFTWF
jgi:hypothetical protein